MLRGLLETMMILILGTILVSIWKGKNYLACLLAIPIILGNALIWLLEFAETLVDGVANPLEYLAEGFRDKAERTLKWIQNQ